jgi:arginase family enzyme
MEEGLAHRLVQIGIRTMNAVQAKAARHFGTETISPESLAAWQGRDGPDRVYVSIDLDALDPAFAPGVSHHEPGGLTVREALAAVRKVRSPIVGARFVKELLACLLNG